MPRASPWGWELSAEKGCAGVNRDSGAIRTFLKEWLRESGSKGKIDRVALLDGAADWQAHGLCEAERDCQRRWRWTCKDSSCAWEVQGAHGDPEAADARQKNAERVSCMVPMQALG